MPAAVELDCIHKTFGPLVALDGVSLTLRPGRVHGLLGENGAGKSTLMNVLYGLLRPDGGAVRVGGQPLVARSPRDAIAAGVGMVHQHFMLAGAMTVLDNVLLGDRRAGPRLDRRRAAGELRALADRLGLPIDPAARVGGLSVGQQQRVEILKALYRRANVLILDEPTAVLTPAESAQLFAAVGQLRAEGKAVVFISHKLGEVKEICDDLTVLRRGRLVWAGPAAGASAAELARHMVGRDVELVSLPRDRPAGAASAGEPALQLDGVTAGDAAGVSLVVRPGEILGVAGVDGNGQQALAEAVVGLRAVTGGRVRISGRDVTRWPATARQALGVAHVPNDRNREGLVGSMSTAENVALKRHDRRPLSKHGILSWRTIRARARELATRFDVRAASVDVPVATLSGGNAQKVILARELALVEPRLVVAMNPVRGLDIAAANFVYAQLLACRAAGCGVLLISSELDELLSLCDRIGVLYGGRFALAPFPADGAAAAIGRMMAGLAGAA